MAKSEDTSLRHLGLILDGNRRWAKSKGLPTLEGHRRGYDSFKDAADAAFDMGVEYVSAYIFSTENWKRTEEEVGYLMDLALRMVTRDLKELHDKNIKLLWSGQTNNVSKKLVKAINEAVELTKDNTGGTLVICFNYGGRPEIIDAIKDIVASGVSAEDINEQIVADAMYCPDVPDCDLIIRTSGEHRLSGFQLWRASYAEFLFIADKHWPDFTPADLRAAVDEFNNRERRIGK